MESAAKQQDSGWEEELSRLAARSDVLLLQEAGLTPGLRGALGRSRLQLADGQFVRPTREPSTAS